MDEMKWRTEETTLWSTLYLKMSKYKFLLREEKRGVADLVHELLEKYPRS